MENGKFFVSVLAVLANVLLAIGKVVVGAISKSAAILADGINSGTDVVASTISFIGIKVAEKPADKEHPYGHGKAEVISGFVITIIILLSGVWILYDSINSIIFGSPLALGILGFIVMALSALVNGIMSQIKIWAGKNYDSVSLVSDGVHSRIDLLVSIVIFIGLFFTRYYSNIDSILAILVGLYILKESFDLGKETTDSLLGKADPETEEEIKKIIGGKNIDLTSLKSQKLGNSSFAEIKVKLPSKLKVEEVEEATKRLEKELIEKIPKLNHTSIQVESHDVGRGYYRPGLGRGFGWRRGGRMEGKVKGARGVGPGGYCVCPKGHYKKKHKRGEPCSQLKCPKCGQQLVRENRELNEEEENDKKN